MAPAHGYRKSTHVQLETTATYKLSLNLLAFLFHTGLEWSDEPYALVRQKLARRQTFFEDIRALTRYMVFESWHHLMGFMIRGLELEAELEAKREARIASSPCSKLDTS